MRFDPFFRNGYICYGGVSMALSPLPRVTSRGCAVIEQIRRPSDILFNKTRLRMYFPFSGKKAVITRKMDSERVWSVCGRAAEAILSDKPVPYGSTAGNGKKHAVRVINKKSAVLPALCLYQRHIAAVLFTPLLRSALSVIAETAALHYSDGSDAPGRAAGVIWAVLPLAVLLRLAVISVKNGYTHYYSSEGVISVARGAVVRRVLHFTSGAADAGISVETPLTRLLKKQVSFVYLNGKGMVAVPDGEICASGGEREIMRLERHCGEGGTWGGYVIIAIVVSIITLHYAIKYIYRWRMIAAALLPVILLLLYRALAESLLGGHPAVQLYRDTITVHGVWGLSAVCANIGRDNIANVSLTQNVIQKNRGLCDMTVKTAGSTRPLLCRNVDMLRARAFIARLCR